MFSFHTEGIRLVYFKMPQMLSTFNYQLQAYFCNFLSLILVCDNLRPNFQ